MDLKTRKPLEVLHWNKYSDGVGFVADGFFYTRLPVPAPGTELTAPSTNVKVYFHHIGDAEDKDKLIYEIPDHPTFSPSISTTEDEALCAAGGGRPESPRQPLYVQNLSNGETGFTPVVADMSDDRYEVIDDDGDDL